MRLVKIGFLIGVLSCLLAGCSREKPVPLRMVQWIHVKGAGFYGQDDRYFYQPENLKNMLIAVRLSGQTMNPAQDPDTQDSKEFCITTAHADGSRHKILIKGDRYIKTEDGPWRQVDPEKLAPLHYLLHFLPGDPI